MSRRSTASGRQRSGGNVRQEEKSEIGVGVDFGGTQVLGFERGVVEDRNATAGMFKSCAKAVQFGTAHESARTDV